MYKQPSPDTKYDIGIDPGVKEKEWIDTQWATKPKLKKVLYYNRGKDRYEIIEEVL